MWSETETHKAPQEVRKYSADRIATLALLVAHKAVRGTQSPTGRKGSTQQINRIAALELSAVRKTPQEAREILSR